MRPTHTDKLRLLNTECDFVLRPSKKLCMSTSNGDMRLGIFPRIFHRIAYGDLYEVRYAISSLEKQESELQKNNTL